MGEAVIDISQWLEGGLGALALIGVFIMVMKLAPPFIAAIVNVGAQLEGAKDKICDLTEAIDKENAHARTRFDSIDIRLNELHNLLRQQTDRERRIRPRPDEK